MPPELPRPRPFEQIRFYVDVAITKSHKIRSNPVEARAAVEAEARIVGFAGRSGNMTSWQMITTLTRYWAAIGWHDLGHGFHDTRQGRRFTIAPDVQAEVLDRLLQLNHERYAEELRQGLHAKKKPKRTSKTAQRPQIDGAVELENSLF
ncbi:MAG: hypothetical protein ACRDSR_28095 [Pseudonocardiaceae bacterium]